MYVRLRHLPLILIGLSASVAVWSGWVELGRLCGFGPVKPFPGISDVEINAAMTLPLGVEAYGATAIYFWLDRGNSFAKMSAVISLALGIVGQATGHVLVSLGYQHAPIVVVIFVSALPVIVLGAATALYHATNVSPQSKVSPGSKVSPENKVSPESNVSPENKVSPESNVSPADTVSPESKVSPADTVSPESNVSPEEMLYRKWCSSSMPVSEVALRLRISPGAARKLVKEWRSRNE